jgi:hypothetical protein
MVIASIAGSPPLPGLMFCLEALTRLSLHRLDPASLTSEEPKRNIAHGGRDTMGKGFLCCAIVAVIIFGDATARAGAQAPFPWPPELSTAQADQPPGEDQEAAPGAPSKKPRAMPGPDVAGNWKGELTQIGESMPYKLTLAVGPNGGQTQYPDLKCEGKLTRIGASKSYVFFIEIITKGAFDKGGRCPDGTITLARSGEKLALVWFGNVKGDTVIAYGTLSK